VLNWFKSKNIFKGDTQNLAEQLSVGDAKKGNIRMERSNAAIS